MLYVLMRYDEDITGYGYEPPTWDGENMLNLLLQSLPVFIPMQSLLIIWDFDCGFWIYLDSYL
jgi:hypothetical protein